MHPAPYFSKSDVVSCKCVDVVSIEKVIPVKLLNATSSPIVLVKCNKIVTFTPIDSLLSIKNVDRNIDMKMICNHVKVSAMPVSACYVDKKEVNSFLSDCTPENSNLSASEQSFYLIFCMLTVMCLSLINPRH